MTDNNHFTRTDVNPHDVFDIDSELGKGAFGNKNLPFFPIKSTKPNYKIIFV